MTVATESMDEIDLLRQLEGERRPDAILIAGPTASGKSDLALRMANLVGGAIVNADSMQVYKDLRILTARPDPAEIAAAPHLLFGHVDGAAAYSAGHWLADANAAVATSWAQGLVPIITGGTGLYFRAFDGGLAEMPDISPEIRDRWRTRLQEYGADCLHRTLQRLDPGSAVELRPSDGQRIARALEVMEETGRSIRDWRRAPGANELLCGKRLVRVVLHLDRAALRRRIAGRFDRMMQLGALAEVERLLSRRLDPAKTVMKAIGVPPLRSHLEGGVALEAAVERAKIDSGRYAKRQDTWFRNQMSDQWRRVAVTAP